ncbi:microfibril-associated glycoprotein 4-like [Mercenaria mercenaria]|uniref:microfibril-associated glycoprotein 4-like n=1 Tax=Mercenaria mercenaria TaxID=6596 RepID=UPI00234F4602|nr:microfibril-associated glycoprotein 4-like [Mercenaria mercenaria]
MDFRIFFVAAIFGTVLAKRASNIYIPLVKIETDNSEESDSQCVTKEYIDEVYANISKRIEEQDRKCHSDEKDYATKGDLAEFSRKLIANISNMFMEQLKAKPIDCEDIRNDGNLSTGIYTIYPYQRAGGISARCDMDTSAGGWTVIQRRVSNSSFYRTWDEYETGFGKLNENFWLGNRNIHLITNQGKYELRVDLTSTDGETAYAQYREFSVGNAESGYKLFVKGYSGTAGDCLTGQNGIKFSTYDKDNDIDSGRNCAVTFHGAWWYTDCHSSNLNGDYGNTDYAKGPVWSSWKGHYSPMKTTEMKVRRKG